MPSIHLSRKPELFRQRGTHGESFWALILTFADRKTDDPIVLGDPIPSATLQQLLKLLRLSQKIVVVSGSGISVNAGCKIMILLSSNTNPI